MLIRQTSLYTFLVLSLAVPALAEDAVPAGGLVIGENLLVNPWAPRARCTTG